MSAPTTYPLMGRAGTRAGERLGRGQRLGRAGKLGAPVGRYPFDLGGGQLGNPAERAGGEVDLAGALDDSGGVEGVFQVRANGQQAVVAQECGAAVAQGGHGVGVHLVGLWTATDRKHGQLIVTALVVAPDNCSYQLANLEALANCT